MRIGERRISLGLIANKGTQQKEEGIQKSTRGHVCDEKTEKVEITTEEKKEACEATEKHTEAEPKKEEEACCTN